MTTRQFYVPGISAGKSQAKILELQRRVLEAQDRIGELQTENATLKDTIAKQDDRIKRMSEYTQAKDLRIERLRRKVADLLGVDVQDLVDSDEGE